MTPSRDMTLAQLRARRAAIAREATRHPTHEQMPYRECEADLMNEEARLKLEIAASEVAEKGRK